MKFKNNNIEYAFRLYESSSSDFQSTIFDLISGSNETKQTKGLAYLLKSNKLLLEKFLSLPKIQNSLKSVNNFNPHNLKSVDYIEVFAEMSSETEISCRRDIVINFYKNNKKIFLIVIEAKNIKLSKVGNIEAQLLMYFDKTRFPQDYHCPHLGITLTKWEVVFNTREFVSITWIELVEILKTLCKDKNFYNNLVLDYYNFITEVDKGMNYYEEEVLSIPAGKSIEFIKNHNIHSCPDNKRGYSYKDSIFMAFREKGSVMDRLYKVDQVIILNPNSPSIDKEILDTKYHERLKGYIDERKQNWEFSSESKYRFYILSDSNQIVLKHKPKPKSSSQGHRYFTLSEILSGNKLI